MDLFDVLRAARSGSEALRVWYAEHPTQVTRQLADALAESARTARREQRLGDAALAAMAASQTFARVGAEGESLQAAWHAFYAMYMQAETAPAYSDVRTGLLKAGFEARSRGYLVMAFKVFALAGDCAFWASEAASSPEAKRDWLVRCLEDLKLAGELSSDADVVTLVPQDAAELHRYASIAGAVFHRARESDFGDRQAAVDELFVHLAQTIERMVALDFSVPNDPAKTQYLALRLAEISNEFGNPQVAARRRAIGAQLG